MPDGARTPRKQDEEDATAVTTIKSSTSTKTPGIAADHQRPNGSGPHDDGELVKRLREQVTMNSDLDAEVRYLQAELMIKNEYLEELEIEIGRLHLVAAEYSAYRNRMSHRSIDGVIVRMHRIPGIYSPMRSVGRTALRRYSRALQQDSEVTKP